MNAVPFDTLSMARKLQASGMESGVAAGMVEALVDALDGAGLATKLDVAGATGAIDGLRTELKTEIVSRQIELKADIATLQTLIRTDNELLRREIVIKFGSMMVIGVGVILAAMRYFLLHQ